MLRPLVTAAVLAASVASAPAAPASAALSPTGGTTASSARTVHLVTGDTVQLLTRADGTPTTRVVSGPHLDGAAARWRTTSSSYLMPRVSGALRTKLDLSLFDVTRLADLPTARVPIVATLRAGAPAAARRATDDALHLRRTSSGSALGWYGPDGLDADDLAAVARVRLAGAERPPAVAPDVPTHELTVEVVTASGDPAPYTTVLIQNVDDSSQFLETPSTDENGVVTVEVPEGDYSMIGWSWSRVVVEPEVSVTADSTVSLDLAEATVRPQVVMSGFRKVDAVLSVMRSTEKGFWFPIEFSGPTFFMRVQPTDADVSHGSLRSGVSAKFVPHGSSAEHPGKIAVTADLADGVPDELTYTHHRRDFARVVQRFYGNGTAGLRQSYVEADGPVGAFFTGHDFDTPVPGRRVLLLQASHDVYYQQTLFPQATPDDWRHIAQLITVRKYRHPGSTYRSVFARGPVGPGAEGADPFSVVGRRHDELYAYLPLLSGAGASSSMSSFVPAEDGHWRLRQGGRRLASGHSEISFDLPVPAARRAYVLRAVSQPTADNWQLSTRVADTWTFHSEHGQRRPPLLTPSYVPPSTMAGYVAPGRTVFRLSFDAPSTRRITGATVELSTDGRHWRAAHLVRTGSDAFRVRYRTPAATADRQTVSLRVTGHDGRGNAVRETAMDVYRLR